MKMKKIKFLTYFALIFSAFTFTSCDNEPIDPAVVIGGENPGTNPNTPAVFKADFNGQTYTTSTVIAELTDEGITIVATKPSGEMFAFVVNSTATGTYPANQNLLSYTPANSEYGYWSIDVAGGVITDTGSITITSINTVNHTISGTFNFTGYWTDTADENAPAPINFTNGVFTNIAYQGSIPNPNPGDEDTFFAKVDGAEFVENVIDVAQVSSEGFPDRISIVASKTSGERIGLLIDQDLEEGTYEITGPLTEDFVSATYINNGLQSAQSGSVTITSKTATRITGTFQFFAENFAETESSEITEGTFDVEYE